MPKYYVKSGQVRFIVDCSDHVCAILSALTYYKGKGIVTALKICISETGFEDYKHWECYDTDKFLKQI